MRRSSSSLKLPPALHAIFKGLQPLLSRLPIALPPTRQAAAHSAVLASACVALLFLASALLVLLAGPRDPRSAAEREDWAVPRNRQCLRSRQWEQPLCVSRELVVWHVPQFQLAKVERWEAEHGGLCPPPPSLNP